RVACVCVRRPTGAGRKSGAFIGMTTNNEKKKSASFVPQSETASGSRFLSPFTANFIQHIPAMVHSHAAIVVLCSRECVTVVIQNKKTIVASYTEPPRHMSLSALMQTATYAP
ncbi:unnamed protein product, partial [Ectocarpus fasciculatus]